jgi:hypothetical protein
VVWSRIGIDAGFVLRSTASPNSSCRFAKLPVNMRTMQIASVLCPSVLLFMSPELQSRSGPQGRECAHGILV